MTRIKELRLHGFKTFADATRFVFGPGINAVIGPNGSGKSNMADAVRWVLGEQSNRSLRTRRGDDVIFAGSDQRRAQGLAEVVLTLDNADGWLPIEYAEVSIARRAFRSGEGEYLINGSRARLREVVDLLSGGRLGANELVVVGQGTVDAALSLRPDERRQLFEEAAGVKNMQVRKNEALSRLDGARDNLARVNDLVVELRPQVRRLSLQAAHQAEHAELAQRAHWLADEGHRRAEADGRDAVGQARRRAAAADADLEAARAMAEAARAELAATEARYAEVEREARVVAEAREGTHERLIRAEARLESISAQTAALQVEIDHAGRERDGLRAELAELVGTVDGQDDLDALTGAATNADERLASATRLLSEREATLAAVEDAIADARRRDAERLAEVARHGEQEARLAARHERIVDELALARHEQQRTEAQLAAATRAASKAAGDAAAAREQRAVGEQALAEARVAAETTRLAAVTLAERVGSLRAELEAIHEGPDHAGGLSRMLVAAGWRPLLDHLEIPVAGWPAAEAVIGAELEDALLWGEGELTERLAQARGSARLLVVGTADGAASEGDPRSLALSAVGASQTLAEWLGLPRAPLAFRRAALAPSLDALLRGWRGLPAGWCGVTVEGDLADGRGVFALRGRGDAPSAQSVRRQARRRELSDLIEGLDARHAAAGVDAARAVARATQAQQAVESTVEHEATSQQAEAVARATRSSSADALRRLAERIGQFSAELDRLDAGTAPPRPVPVGGDDLARLEGEETVAAARRVHAAAERDAARTAWRAARDALEESELRRPRAADRLQREAHLEATERLLQVRVAALSALESSALSARADFEEAAGRDVTAAATRAAVERERDQARAGLLAAERSALEGTARVAELERFGQSHVAEVSRLEAALASLADERQAAPEAAADDGAPVVTGGAPPPDVAELHPAGLAQELQRVRRLLAQLGSVNPFAIEEHRELADRLDGLTGQEIDLRGAIESTTELIGRLESEIASRFDAAFAAIGAKFAEYCQLLFGGGSASLSLGESVEGDAPGGIEIAVRPPGKRLQRLSMLSGGERALTGVALLFAMLDVNPVPFCILDEVDAALDEANIGRFAAALRQLSSRIDFVVITHNRATIEVADTIYGVTMTDAAASKVVSLRLADLPVEVMAG